MFFFKKGEKRILVNRYARLTAEKRGSTQTAGGGAGKRDRHRQREASVET